MVLAFWEVTTRLPVFSSISLRVLPAIVPSVFAIFLFTSGIVSLSSISAAISLPIVLFLFDRFTSMEVDAVLMGVSIVIPLFIIFTHRTNIQRLLKGEENSFENLKIFRKKKNQ